MLSHCLQVHRLNLQRERFFHPARTCFAPPHAPARAQRARNFEEFYHGRRFRPPNALFSVRTGVSRRRTPLPAQAFRPNERRRFSRCTCKYHGRALRSYLLLPWYSRLIYSIGALLLGALLLQCTVLLRWLQAKFGNDFAKAPRVHSLVRTKRHHEGRSRASHATNDVRQPAESTGGAGVGGDAVARRRRTRHGAAGTTLARGRRRARRLK